VARSHCRFSAQTAAGAVGRQCRPSQVRYFDVGERLRNVCLRIPFISLFQAVQNGMRFSHHPFSRLFNLGGEAPPLAFYEAEFVKTRCENSFLFILIHFGRHLAATYLLAFGA
jgi:hypothetical protein